MRRRDRERRKKEEVRKEREKHHQHHRCMHGSVTIHFCTRAHPCWSVLCLFLFVLAVFSADATELFCICRTPYDNDRFYLGCESCENWFHGKCVHITEEQVSYILGVQSRSRMRSLFSLLSSQRAHSLFDCFPFSLRVRRHLQAALIQDYICEACEKKTGRITTFVDNVSRMPMGSFKHTWRSQRHPAGQSC